MSGWGKLTFFGLYRYVQPKRICFVAVLVRNRVLIFDFSHFGLKLGMVFALYS